MASESKICSIVRDELDLSSLEYARLAENALVIGGVPWEKYNGILTPYSAPHVPVNVDRDELAETLERNKMLLACWATDWDMFSDSQWWWIVCDMDQYDVHRVDSSRGRRSIRRGLNKCIVERLGFYDFLRLSYPLHSEALKGYGLAVPNEEQYAEEIATLARNPGNHFWGAFVDEQMAAYLVCRVLDGVCRLVTTGSSKELKKHNPMAAMFYSVCKYYLDRKLNYVTNGWRTLLHETAMNDFLETLGFRKVFCQVNVELSSLAKAVDRSRMIQWGAYLGLHKILGYKWKQLEGFNRLMDISQSFPSTRKNLSIR